MATIQEILDKINASKSNNVNNNSFIDLMRQISGNPEDATAPVNDTNSIYGHIVQMYTTLYGSGVDYAILADEVDMLQGVYDNLIAINSVHADKTKLDSLYADKTKLDQLFADKAVVDRVYGSIANIDRVHTSIDKLDTVYASVLKIDIVADNIADVNTVADNMIVLNEIYNNRVEIYAADNNAAIATTKASEASASAATTLGYKNDVSAMKLAVETIYDTFDDRFLGTKTADPTLDNDGNALTDGVMYFNTTDNAMKVYDAGTTTWYSIPQIYLSGLLDVELISITTGDILVWNGTKWSNTANPKVDSIQFNGGSGTEGTVSWNSDEGTLDLVANTTTLQIGQETYIHVLNQSGSTILDGTVVMAVGTLGASGRILVQPYDGVSLPKYILGIATESLATGQSGKVTNFGKIRGLNTSAWNEGDELFVTINGGLTNVEPTTGINVAIAYVINKHANNGTVMVRFTPYDENLAYTKAESDTLLSGHTDLVNNPHDVTKDQVGLSNADNTSDANKPISTATQSALDLKANLASPTFTGTPTAPTAVSGDNSTQLATTEFVTSAVANPDVYQGAYGFNWDYSTDMYVRTGAAGYTSIQAMMKRCVLNANGTVNYYLHPTNSNFKADGTPSVLTGADGNVMVQVPKFYVKIETVGNVDKYSISLTPDVGYVVHPWFVKAGVEVDYRYYRAYTGYNSGGTLKSISGVAPTRIQTIATFRSQAMANGTGWHLTDWNAVNAIKLLCYIEFNDYIVTDYIGTGNDTGSDYGLTTGQSNAIGNASSLSTNSDTWMSYRGIENFYADCWEFLDGININNYVFYVNQNYTTFASDVFTGDYVSKGTTIAASASYITRCTASVSGGWIPSVIGGASTTYYGDGFWSTTGAMVALFGGSAIHGALDGAGALSVDGASSLSAASLGGAVCF